MNTGGIFRLRVLLLLVIILSSAAISHVAAHAPLNTGSNEQLANATVISDPEKSYVIYTELHEGSEAQYYRFTMDKGQVLSGSLQVPGPDSMVPEMVIIGPGIPSSGQVPAFIEIPPGSGARQINGSKPGAPSFEPFSPQPIYEVSRFREEISVPGDYYIAVYGNEGGKYSLAPGSKELFTVEEWLTIPYSVIGIHMWEGQSLAMIIAPFCIIVIAGLVLMFLRQKKSGNIYSANAWIGATSGLLYIGGAGITALQLVHTVSLTGYDPGVVLTLIFISIPVVLGVVLIKISLELPVHGTVPRRTALTYIIMGALGLLFWCGLILGPLLAIISGLLLFKKN
jgi:hypothetical protein